MGKQLLEGRRRLFNRKGNFYKVLPNENRFTRAEFSLFKMFCSFCYLMKGKLVYQCKKKDRAVVRREVTTRPRTSFPNREKDTCFSLSHVFSRALAYFRPHYILGFGSTLELRKGNDDAA